ncbi:LppU/SCO3897 family protein [Saccharothrix sp. Mg75]|uniref:LppU/SCO3897 family protein n=1 Tax=Saccharothrix sp. Mg75 TaxID=3445357 RepID=UPI003EECB865
MRKTIRWGIGAVGLVVVGAFATTALGADPEGPPVGACARIEGTAKAAKYQAVDCSSDRATVKVAKVVEEGGKCPAGGGIYSTYTGSSTLCLIPNFVEGGCYQRDQQTGLRKVDCSTTGSVRVVKASKGPVDCGDDRTLRYPEPAVTFCLTHPA